ncbi:hypothetical protein ACEN8I_05800 [Polaromonas sp. CT11-55]|uniref:hypothetical protein n=1 Tax=Polaromonas sp. CT11-55 TaxID=3243045 RepID=UPI0039A4F6D7
MYDRISKRVKQVCVIGFVAILLTGCATTPAPVDPRTPEERQAAFDSAAQELIGNYVVIEKRNEFFNGRNLKVNEVVVSRSGDALVYLLKGERDKPLLMMASDCMTRYPTRPNEIYCHNTFTEMASVDFSKANTTRKVSTGGLIDIHGPMAVNQGDYLLYFMERGPGRVHYYLLKKK